MTTSENSELSTRERLLGLIESSPGIDREAMIAGTGLPSGAVDPARLRLWRSGWIEPTDEAGWESALANRVKGVGWRTVDAGARQAVQERASQRKARNAKPPPEEQAAEIVDALRDSTVAKLVEAMTRDASGSSRVRRQAQATLRAQEIARKKEAREAQRERNANAEFQKMLVALFEARGAVAAVDDQLVRERVRSAEGRNRKISDVDWETALHDVRLIVESLGHIWENFRDISGEALPCPACGAAPPELDREIEAFGHQFVAEGSLSDESVIVDAEIV